jgi:hypothetical protein
MTKLRRHQRRTARRIARNSWIKSKGDIDQCKSLFEQEALSLGIDPATIISLLIFAMKLWLWWQERKIESPGLSPIDGEPTE